MRIYVDFDSTIVNSIKCICDMYNEDFKYYKKFQYVHWTDINTWNFLECNCAKTEYINTYFNQERFFSKLTYMDNAKEVLDRLKDKYEIVIVSLGYRPNLIGKMYWVEDNLPYAKFLGLNMKSNKDKRKIDMSDGILIDDKSSNLNTNAKELICFGDRYEWNEDWKGKRCYNWTELEKYINEQYGKEVNKNGYINKPYAGERIIK